MKKILFLCTGNSCRSQIAEGLGKIYLQKYNIDSAGTEAHGINLNAIKTMNNINIDISKQTSKKINLLTLDTYDLIITLCGDANDKCSIINKNIKHIHWEIKDPAKIKGTKEEIAKGFTKIRDEILIKIKSLNESIKNEKIFS